MAYILWVLIGAVLLLAGEMTLVGLLWWAVAPVLVWFIVLGLLLVATEFFDTD